ncbi:hypothetical protein BASA81_011124 [Batrachochytrium salamandrivorans]|nr:hypothetical protein BASA81_011124 [Batrachochytrium salamandrivorans]
MKKLLVVDVMYLAYRSFYAFSSAPLVTKTSKIPTSVVYAMAATCLKMLKQERPDYLAFCTDSPGLTFRHVAFPQYKSQRNELPPDLDVQLPLAFRLLSTFNVPVLKLDGYEADDLIGSLAVKFASSECKVLILSKDKDFMQLVNPNVTLLKQDNQGAIQHVDCARVMETLGIRPNQMVDYLAICGDASDNVPGVKGIGPKGAAELLGQFATLEDILANLDKVKSPRHVKLLQQFQLENRDGLAKQLVTIKTDVPITQSLNEFKIASCEEVVKSPQLVEFCKEMECQGLLKRFAVE